MRAGPATARCWWAVVQEHQDRSGRAPDLVAADPGFYSKTGEVTAKAMASIKRVSVPTTDTKSARHKQEQKRRWFKKGLRRRISVLK